MHQYSISVEVAQATLSGTLTAKVQKLLLNFNFALLCFHLEQ